jgi:hypothetical protein
LKHKKGAKSKKSTKSRKGVKNEHNRKVRPRNIWNSLRKLENYLHKTDIQANIFMESINELREIMSFEIKSSFVHKLCNSVHGDLLSALWDHKRLTEEDEVVGEKEKGAGVILLGVFEVLAKFLDLQSYKANGERLFVTREMAKYFDFDEIPENLNDDRVQDIEVEVLRCGWKIGEKVIQKPKVFVVS